MNYNYRNGKMKLNFTCLFINKSIAQAFILYSERYLFQPNLSSPFHLGLFTEIIHWNLKKNPLVFMIRMNDYSYIYMSLT